MGDTRADPHSWASVEQCWRECECDCRWILSRVLHVTVYQVYICRKNMDIIDIITGNLPGTECKQKVFVLEVWYVPSPGNVNKNIVGRVNNGF